MKGKKYSLIIAGILVVAMCSQAFALSPETAKAQLAAQTQAMLAAQQTAYIDSNRAYAAIVASNAQNYTAAAAMKASGDAANAYYAAQANANAAINSAIASGNKDVASHVNTANALQARAAYEANLAALAQAEALKRADSYNKAVARAELQHKVTLETIEKAKNLTIQAANDYAKAAEKELMDLAYARIAANNAKAQEEIAAKSKANTLAIYAKNAEYQAETQAKINEIGLNYPLTANQSSYRAAVSIENNLVRDSINKFNKASVESANANLALAYAQIYEAQKKAELKDAENVALVVKPAQAQFNAQINFYKNAKNAQIANDKKAWDSYRYNYVNAKRYLTASDVQNCIANTAIFKADTANKAAVQAQVRAIKYMNAVTAANAMVTEPYAVAAVKAQARSEQEFAKAIAAGSVAQATYGKALDSYNKAVKEQSQLQALYLSILSKLGRK